MNTVLYSVLVIAVMAVVTVALRFLPFLLFDRGSEPPSWVKYLGKVLPPAVMSVLLIYCVRSVELTAGNHGLPDFICIAVAIGMHIWRRNTLLSIGVSTVLYMVLIQFVFV